jgi:hypothetical protein
VVALHQGGAAIVTLIECLENLGDDPDQLNRDVIEDVMDWMLVAMAGGKS